jgi:hypothetical protein
VQLTLIGRAYCHLCDEMRVAVNAALQAAGAPAAGAFVVEIDLDEHPALEERFSEWVPVLLLGTPDEGVEICHYHFDPVQWASHTGFPQVTVS